MEENRNLKELVREELHKGSIGMSQLDFSLMETTADILDTKPVDYVRVWLVDVYLARGELHNVDKESKAIRNGPNYRRKERTLTDVKEGEEKRKRLREDLLRRSSKKKRRN